MQRSSWPSPLNRREMPPPRVGLVSSSVFVGVHAHFGSYVFTNMNMKQCTVAMRNKIYELKHFCVTMCIRRKTTLAFISLGPSLGHREMIALLIGLLDSFCAVLLAVLSWYAREYKVLLYRTEFERCIDTSPRYARPLRIRSIQPNCACVGQTSI